MKIDHYELILFRVLATVYDTPFPGGDELHVAMSRGNSHFAARTHYTRMLLFYCISAAGPHIAHAVVVTYGTPLQSVRHFIYIEAMLKRRQTYL